MGRLIMRPVEWAYDVTATWIMVRPESPLVFTAHMLLRAILATLRRMGF